MSGEHWCGYGDACAHGTPSNTDAIQEGEGDDLEAILAALYTDPNDGSERHSDAYEALDRIARTIEQQQARIEEQDQHHAEDHWRIEELEAALRSLHEEARRQGRNLALGNGREEGWRQAFRYVEVVLDEALDPSTKGEGE